MGVDQHDNSDQSLLLPTQFFSHQDDQDPDVSFIPSREKHRSTSTSTSHWSSFSDSGSDSSSPFDSELGSSNDSEDYISELTRQMAHYMLQDDDDYHHPEVEKCWGSSASGSVDGSPQSTLWSGPKVGPSRKPSPPAAPTMMEFEKPPSYNHRDDEISLPLSNQNAAFQSKQALINDQIRAIQFHKLKQGQETKQLEQRKPVKNYQTKGKASSGAFSNNGSKAIRLPSTLQHQPPPPASSGMRAVFLNGSGSKPGSSLGTGVFLPRGAGYSSESRKKPGCSTVLIPARVVQALKQHFDKVGVPRPSRLYESFPLQHDGLTSGWRNDSLYPQQQQKKQQQTWPEPGPGPGPGSARNSQQELGLPQEWTY